MRHVRQELRLVSAGGLELSVEALELVVHPVDIGRQCAEFVAVRDVDLSREVPGGDRGEPGVDPLDRADQRPREHEPQEQREDDRPRGCGDEEVSRARVRARVLGGQGVGLRRRDIRELGCTLVEVDREQPRIGTRSDVSRGEPASRALMSSRTTLESRSPVDRIRWR